MTKMTVTAKKVYTITWDGDNQGYIRAGMVLSMRLKGEGLDSLDMGDATGIICEWIDAPDANGNPASSFDACSFVHEGHLLTGSYDWELFEYEGKGDDPEILTS